MLPSQRSRTETRVEDEVLARRSYRESMPEVVVAVAVAVASNAYFLNALLR